MLIKKSITKKAFILLTILFSIAVTAQEEGMSKVFLLTEMSSGNSNVKTSGSEMSWQEHIVLHFDGTFTKTREIDNKYEEAQGKFVYEDQTDGKYIKLTYSSKSEMIVNCTSDLVELLKVNSEKEIQGTALACDGKGFVYKLAE